MTDDALNPTDDAPNPSADSGDDDPMEPTTAPDPASATAATASTPTATGAAPPPIPAPGASPGNATVADADEPGDGESSPWTLAAAFGLLILALIALGIAAWAIRSHLEVPEVVLTLLLIFGIVVLLTTIGALVVLLAGFRLTTRKEALGLPSGSVRAIIALGLLLVFSIVSVFLFWNTGHDIVESTGITADQLALLPKDRIVSIQATGTTYTVGVISGTGLSDQLAQQLMTMLGTLLTAVAAFYFGSASVSAAYKASQGAAADARAGRQVTPPPGTDGAGTDAGKSPDGTDDDYRTGEPDSADGDDDVLDADDAAEIAREATEATKDQDASPDAADQD